MAWMIKPGGLSRYRPDPDPIFETQFNTSERNKHMDMLKVGRRVDDQFPKLEELALDCGVKRPPKIFDLFNGCFVGQQSFVDLVESFEPAVHQWFPVRIRNKKTGEYSPHQYFVLNVCNLLRSVVLNERYVKLNDSFRFGVSWCDKSGGVLLKLHKDAVRGHHIWRDDRRPESQIFVSDAFGAALEAYTPEDKGWFHTKGYLTEKPYFEEI